ncbi:MAG: hypothetical protein ACD_34C00096G0006, partial [uncultured bacterium]
MTFRAATDYTLEVRGVAQLAAHRVWDAGVGGSSPPTPTIYYGRLPVRVGVGKKWGLPSLSPSQFHENGGFIMRFFSRQKKASDEFKKFDGVIEAVRRGT